MYYYTMTLQVIPFSNKGDKNQLSQYDDSYFKDVFQQVVLRLPGFTR
jgi:hypothetical protein